VVHLFGELSFEQILLREMEKLLKNNEVFWIVDIENGSIYFLGLQKR
jgi:hypothetical protein